jgi:hypothetical protein
VEQLCGQPYQLAIAVADLRAALRYAYEHRDEDKRRGLMQSLQCCFVHQLGQRLGRNIPAQRMPSEEHCESAIPLGRL